MAADTQPFNHPVSALLGTEGPIAGRLPGFAPRREQQQLAEAVEGALYRESVLIGEAGTGTGKTFAYLLPAVRSGLRVIVSTGTRHLQDQLYEHDLPLVCEALGAGVSVSLLKGRANYLCRHRLARAVGHPLLGEAWAAAHMAEIRDWARYTQHGDIAEVTTVPEDSPVWPLVTSNEEFCAQHDYDELADCFVRRARKRAQEADIVVINHHLLCADLALKAGGYGELLTSANAFIIDEAHQFPEIAAQFFGERLSSRQLLELARDTVGEYMHEASDTPALRDLAMTLESAVRQFRLAFAVEPRREAWTAVVHSSALQRDLGRLADRLDALSTLLSTLAPRGKGLESCHRRALKHADTLARFTRPPAEQPCIHWYETYRSGFGLNMTPMSVAEPFQRAVQSMCASWVFTSATLAVGGDFGHFRRQLGLMDAEELQLDSPFDYRAHAILYLPEGLPEPATRGYTDACMHAVLPVLQASGGRAFLLFTSYRALEAAARYLGDKLEFPLLCQGQMPKRELIERFTAIGNAVLLGTSSFWEGVDVRGSALSVVVIDKLPFHSPGDPVISARIEHLRQRGANPFVDYQLPQAVIALKQGAGRLIRDVSDSGALVLCDPRVRTRHYGDVFINSLPPIPITRDVADVVRFLACRGSPGSAPAVETRADPELRELS